MRLEFSIRVIIGLGLGLGFGIGVIIITGHLGYIMVTVRFLCLRRVIRRASDRYTGDMPL